jgi:2-keto-4-pentenoate hydratase/2-oxohepta-3-ene-1,7-dioic acid hydratase in catechol pathway
MRIVRFEIPGKSGVRAGLETDGLVRELAGDIFGPYDETKGEFPLDDVRLLAPCSPTKITAVGLNYRDHAEEMKLDIPEEPLLFMKPSSSIIGPGDTVRMPSASKRVDYEAELGVVIGRTAYKIPRENAWDYILGYTCLNDVTARDLQGKDGQWTRGKGFDTFCPIGPVIETGLDPSDITVEAYLNGERKQSSSTRNLIFDVSRLVSFISSIMTLFPGDVIATGTPSGVGPMESGDRIEIRVEGIGSLINPVAAE